VTTFPIMMTGRHVEEAVIETCVKWGAEFISEGERQFGIEPHSVPVPALGQYTTTSTAFEKWPEDQTPAVLVIAPGLTGPPRIEADRSLTAPLGLGLGFLVSTSHGPTANRELAAFYAAVFSELILRMPLQLQNVPVGVDEITLPEGPASARRPASRSVRRPGRLAARRVRIQHPQRGKENRGWVRPSGTVRLTPSS
jgi:hypothetical protein